MKLRIILVLCSIFGMVLTAPQYDEETEYQHEYREAQEKHHPPIPIVHHKSEMHPEGYKFSFKTGNGIQAEESGYVKKTGDKEDDHIMVMHGSVSYTGPDGVPVKLTYVADENGFQPQGTHIPTPPPLPEEILKTIKQAHSHSNEHVLQSHDEKSEYSLHYQ